MHSLLGESDFAVVFLPVEELLDLTIPIKIRLDVCVGGGTSYGTQR